MHRAATGPQQIQAQPWHAEVDSHKHVRTVRLAVQERPEEASWSLADDAAGLEQFLRQGARSLRVSLQLSALQLPWHRALGNVLRAVAQSGASVTHLDLSANGLGDDAAEEIARFVECQDDPLSELQLGNNRISAFGLAQICAALASRRASDRGGGAASPAPCWLDLRGNAVDRPREVMRCLDELGVPTCSGARCCRQRCITSAPVHLAGGLGPQRAARRWHREELVESLRRVPERVPECSPAQQVARPFLGLDKRIPPPPGEDKTGIAAQMAEWTIEDCLRLQPLALSPLGLPDVPAISEGQIIQAQRSTWAGPRGNSGAVAGEMLKVLKVSPIEFWTSERVKVTAAAEGENGRAFWVNVRDVAATPALQ